MRWLIKDKSPEEYIHKGFAIFPTKVQCYWIWLEPYFYYCLPPSYACESKTKVKFLNHIDCEESLLEHINNGGDVV